MTDTITCEHCNVVLKNKYNLKAHLNNNKTCLSKRNISLNDKFTCNGCDSIFTLKTNFTKHINTCKSYNKVIKEQKYTHVFKSDVLLFAPPSDNLVIKVALDLKLKFPKDIEDQLRAEGLLDSSPANNTKPAVRPAAKPAIK